MKQDFYDMLLERVSEAARHARWIFTAVVVASLVQAVTAYSFVWGGKRAYVEDLVFNDGLPRTSTAAAKAPTRPASGSVGAAALDEMRRAMVEKWVEEQTFEVGLLGVKLDGGDAQQLGGVTIVSLMLWLLYAVRRENRLVKHVLEIVASEPPEVRAHVFHALATSRLFANLPDEDVASDARGESADWVRVGRVLGFLILCIPALSLLFVALTDYWSVFHLQAVFRGAPDTLYKLRGGVSPVFLRAMASQAIALGATLLAIAAILRLQSDTCAWLDAARAKRWSATVPERPVPA